MKILVVDDNAVTLDAMAELLGLAGHQVDVADDGADALKRLGLRVPDVMVLDWCLPVLDGREVLERLRASPEWAHIPILVLTAADSRTVQAIQETFPLVKVYQKPIEGETLLRAIQTLAEAHRQGIAIER